MACGGMYIVRKETPIERRQWYDSCIQCGDYYDKQGKWPNLYIEEWDGTMCHESCLIDYLKSEEGQLMRSHKHDICCGNRVVLYEGQDWPDNWEHLIAESLANPAVD